MVGFVNRARGNVLYASVLVQRLLRTTRNNVTARAGGGKALATPLLYGLNRITVCATGADSVLLPAAVDGAEVVIIHDGAAAAQVFGQGTDTVDGIATATGVALTQLTRCAYYCISNGAWYSLKGTKST